jgi:hypothetical protein
LEDNLEEHLNEEEEVEAQAEYDREIAPPKPYIPPPPTQQISNSTAMSSGHMDMVTIIVFIYTDVYS